MTGHAADRTMRAAAAVVAAVACALAGCMSQAPPAASPAAQPSLAAGSLPRARQVWMLTRSALAELLADPPIRTELGKSQVYEILQPGQEPLPGVVAAPVVTFASVTGLSHALAAGQLPAGTRAVLYDPEAWSFTPAAEQRDPVQAATRAAELARAHGLQLIVAPALNLTSVLSPGSAAPRWQQFLDLRLAAKIAKVADVIELQAQSLERTTGTYAAFVREAAGQARGANPGTTVLAGLSTNPPGATVASRQLAAAIEASREWVDGYWLNIPGRGPRCPTCNQKRLDVGIEALRAIL
jgi:hypothetical protein